MISDNDFNKIIEQFDEAERLLNEDISSTYYVEVFNMVMPLVEKKQVSREQALIIRNKLAKAGELFAAKKEELKQGVIEQTNRFKSLKAYIKTSHLKK